MSLWCCALTSHVRTCCHCQKGLAWPDAEWVKVVISMLSTQSYLDWGCSPVWGKQGKSSKVFHWKFWEVRQPSGVDKHSIHSRFTGGMQSRNWSWFKPPTYPWLPRRAHTQKRRSKKPVRKQKPEQSWKRPKCWMDLQAHTDPSAEWKAWMMRFEHNFCPIFA